MKLLSAFLIAASLSMDNFAISLASGCSRGGPLHRGRILLVSASFSLAHIVMFGLGWWGGWELGQWINRWDHWIAFFILAFVGAKMIKEALADLSVPDFGQVLPWKRIIGLSVAASLDALGVGVALSLEKAPFWMTLIFMTGCVFVTSYAGFLLGRLLGKRFGKVMEIAGGVVLIGLGTKILFSGLGIW